MNETDPQQTPEAPSSRLRELIDAYTKPRELIEAEPAPAEKSGNGRPQGAKRRSRSRKTQRPAAQPARARRAA